MNTGSQSTHHRRGGAGSVGEMGANHGKREEEGEANERTKEKRELLALLGRVVTPGQK